MEWSKTSNVQNERVAFMPPPRLESNNWLHSFNYDPYAGNSYTHAVTQTGPVITVPESDKLINAYQCPSNNNEMIKKKKRLTSEQIASLELRFQEDFKLDSERKLKLSNEGLEPRQVAVWFQNRRSRWKLKHLEESYDSLRQEYDVIWREKQMLQDEVKKLRAIILRDQGLMMNSNQTAGGDQTIGLGDQYNSLMMVASSGWPPISQPPNPW